MFFKKNNPHFKLVHLVSFTIIWNSRSSESSAKANTNPSLNSAVLMLEISLWDSTDSWKLGDTRKSDKDLPCVVLFNGNRICDTRCIVNSCVDFPVFFCLSSLCIYAVNDIRCIPEDFVVGLGVWYIFREPRWVGEKEMSYLWSKFDALFNILRIIRFKSNMRSFVHKFVAI